MTFWEKIFGTKTDQKNVEPSIKFGRFSDSYKEKAQYDAWEESIKAFEDLDYLKSYQAFLRYIRDEREDNVRWADENGGVRFEILQGSKRISGFADARQVKAEAKIAHAKELGVAFMRRLVEANYALEYSRFALDDDNNLIIKFDSSTLDGSPYKLYYALKEIAVNADKQDDLLLDEFAAALTPLEMGSKREIPDAEKEIKHDFIKEKLQIVFDELEKGSLNTEKYPGGISYLLLSTIYKTDYLTTPEGFVMETFERAHRIYFNKDNKTMVQRNSMIIKELEKIKARSKEAICSELYNTTSTFGVLSPNNHEAIVSLIDGELPNMTWYEENKHERIALSVVEYIIGYSLFYYALPKPVKEFLALYYRIVESRYFSALNFTPQYFDSENKSFNQKEIKNAVRRIVDRNKEKFPTLSPDSGILDFKTPCTFARSYLLMLKATEVIPKS